MLARYHLFSEPTTTSQNSKARAKYDKVGGIILSGTTGEQHSMTIEERCLLFERGAQIGSKYDIPIVAGISATTIPAIKRLAQSALSSGCQGIMLGLPPYSRPNDSEVLVYIHAVKSLLPETFPIVLYNNVMRNGYGPSLPVLAELCRNNTIWGIKHAVAPEVFKEQANQLIQLFPEIRLYTGGDGVAGEVLNYDKIEKMNFSEDEIAPKIPKFYGLTSILGNIYPEEIADMVSNLTLATCAEGTAPTSSSVGEELHSQLITAVDACIVGCSLPVGVKYALRVQGINSGHTRQPVGSLTPDKKSEIEQALTAFPSTRR